MLFFFLKMLRRNGYSGAVIHNRSGRGISSTTHCDNVSGEPGENVKNGRKVLNAGKSKPKESLVFCGLSAGRPWRGVASTTFHRLMGLSRRFRLWCQNDTNFSLFFRLGSKSVKFFLAVLDSNKVNEKSQLSTRFTWLIRGWFLSIFLATRC